MNQFWSDDQEQEVNCIDLAMVSARECGFGLESEDHGAPEGVVTMRHFELSMLTDEWKMSWTCGLTKEYVAEDG